MLRIRGEKWTLWEGGVRGTSFLWSPILQGTPRVSHQLMHITDWLPTLLDVAGYDMAKLALKPLDGVDMWAALVGDLPSKRKEVLLNIDPVGWESAVRVGDYKVLFHGGKGNAQWFPQPQFLDVDPMKSLNQVEFTMGIDKESVVPDYLFESEVHNILLEMGRKPEKGSPLRVDCGEKPANASWNCVLNEAPCLYNIMEDPCEYNNIAHQRPDILRAAMDRLNAYNVSMVAMKNKPIDPTGLPGNNGFWAFKPWVKSEK